MIEKAQALVNAKQAILNSEIATLNYLITHPGTLQIQGLKDHNQHLELNLERVWQAM